MVFSGEGEVGSTPVELAASQTLHCTSHPALLGTITANINEHEYQYIRPYLGFSFVNEVYYGLSSEAAS